ncbi:hypothetical protein [Nocardioides dongxiaopingii]|uniref:hypothetical protein n=1 Tax=Nocardioides dongxiaopingii TaxID=2576036 RepID=UPI0010C770B9|nr:hypothetical protein [Nocardioides dongxiaopingii]
MESLVDVMRVVVEPAVRAVLTDRELTSMHLTRDQLVGYSLSLVAVGETFQDWVVQDGVPHLTLADWRERLRSNLVDFVAESGFGWGQDREHGPPA